MVVCHVIGQAVGPTSDHSSSGANTRKNPVACLAEKGRVPNMKIKHFSVLLASLTLLLAFQDILAADASAVPNSKSQISQDKVMASLLSETDRVERLIALRTLMENRTNYVRKLMAVLEGDGSDDFKVSIAIVLGEYRAVECIPFLMQHLEPDHRYPRMMVNGRLPPPDLVTYKEPMRAALEKIGAPAIPPLMGKITQTDNAQLMEKCLSICNAIEGAEVTQFRLQRLSEKETDPKKKERLQSALKVYESLKATK